MGTKIKNIISGDMTVIGSGTLISFGNDDVVFEFGTENLTLKVILSFENNGGEIKLDAKSLSTTDLRFTLFNAISVLGSGPLVPIGIGELNGKKLFISFRVYTIDDSDQRTIHYTFYEEQ